MAKRKPGAGARKRARPAGASASVGASARASARASVRASVHPALQRSLDAALAQEREGEAPLIDLVVTLRPDDPGGLVDEPEATRRKCEELIERASELSGDAPEEYNVFEYMQSVAVRARPRFVERILELPVVATAVPNKLPDEQANGEPAAAGSIGGAVRPAPERA